MPLVPGRSYPQLQPPRVRVDKRKAGAVHISKCPRCGDRGKYLTREKAWCSTCGKGFLK